MNIPILIVFDIDATLIRPSIYHSVEDIKRGLYDDKLLTPFLSDPAYQVALASFNQEEPTTQPIGGRRLGRIILDLQHPYGNSFAQIPDEFIQAWMYPSMEQINKYGKNNHLELIINAYIKKYKTRPAKIIFYDDSIDNVYLARKRGVMSFWVPQGLTLARINNCIQIGHRILFSTNGQIGKCGLQAFVSFIYIHSRLPNTDPVYSFYLFVEKERAQQLYTSFIEYMNKCGINIQILESDL